MRFRPLFYFISCFLLLSSVLSITFWQFKYSADFVGGTSWTIRYPDSLDSGKIVSEVFKPQNIEPELFNYQPKEITFKFKNIDQDTKLKLEEGMKKIEPNLEEVKFETIGPILGRELIKKTLIAVALSSLSILIFIGSKFKDYTFGASAVLAMFHDTIILTGAFSILGHFWGAEIDSLFVTALLTTLSASVHDTVVTFDRIRELRRKNFQPDWTNLANQAVSEVIVRSLNNSLTIILMLSSLVLLGGAVTRWFAIALLIGVIAGTYSSIGVAIPLVLFWKNRQKK